jgi:VanZ family protein
MVLVWLGVIRVESTDMASAADTSSVLYHVLRVVSPHIDPGFVAWLDEILRKTGHFLGYGILSALVFLALRNTNRDRVHALLPRTWGIHLRDLWRMEWAAIAVLFTIATASCDEIHQTFIPSRTGRWQDVVLDTCGAMVVQLILYRLATHALKQHRESAPQPEFTSTR